MLRSILVLSALKIFTQICKLKCSNKKLVTKLNKNSIFKKKCKLKKDKRTK